MYCKYCGTQITDGDASDVVCTACKARIEQKQVAQTAQSAEQQQPNPRMLGLKIGIAGAVTGYFGMIFVLVTYFAAVYGVATGNYVYAVSTLIALALFSLPMMIVAFLFGMKGIKIFRTATQRKPIATLVLGIHAVFFATFSCFWFLIDLLFAVVSLVVF